MVAAYMGIKPKAKTKAKQEQDMTELFNMFPLPDDIKNTLKNDN